MSVPGHVARAGSGQSVARQPAMKTVSARTAFMLRVSVVIVMVSGTASA